MLLYGHPLSGNTHKVRLLLSALDIPHEERAIDVTKGEQKSKEYLAVNPRGQVPAVVDGPTTVFDAQAILTYLALKYDASSTWLPAGAAQQARLQGWLSFAANEIQNGCQLARMHYLLGVPVAIEAVQALARDSLRLLDAGLAGRSFLEGETPTIADLACYPCTALAPQGKVAVDPYPNVQRWIERIEALPFCVAMPGLGALR